MTHSVLVIEDEPVVRENVTELLELEGMKVISAPNGEAGTQLAREFLPDLIICDIMMPGRDGYGVLFELQNDTHTANIPFIFLTAKADRDSLRYGMTLGADDYVSKPFTPHELLSAVATRLDKKTRVVQEHAEETEALRQSLLRTLPHELRTPLVAVLGGAELLLMDQVADDREQVTQTANLILQSGKRLQRTIENYLLLAQLELIKEDAQRIESFRSAITRQPDEVVRKAAELVARAYKRENELKLNLCKGAVCVSPDILERIVQELVDNAFKFSSKGQMVSLSTSFEDNSFTLHVNDQGRGMSVEQISKLGAFVQFGRAAYEQQGAELGIALAKRLIELHDGILLIQSEPQRGTRVRIHLPGPATN